MEYTRYLLKVTIILLVSFQLSCSKIENNPDNSQYDFAIYLLKDPNIKINDILTFELVNINFKKYIPAGRVSFFIWYV